MLLVTKLKVSDWNTQYEFSLDYDFNYDFVELYRSELYKQKHFNVTIQQDLTMFNLLIVS